MYLEEFDIRINNIIGRIKQKQRFCYVNYVLEARYFDVTKLGFSACCLAAVAELSPYLNCDSYSSRLQHTIVVHPRENDPRERGGN